MREYTFTEGEISVTVGALSHRLLTDQAALEYMLNVHQPTNATGMHPAEYSDRRRAISLLVHTRSVTGLDFKWPGSRAWQDEALDVVNRLFDVDGKYDALVSKWFDAIDMLVNSLFDMDLLPSDKLAPDYLKQQHVINKREELSEWLSEVFDKEAYEDKAVRDAIRAGKPYTRDFSDVENIGLNYNTKAEIVFTMRCLNYLEQFNVLPEPGGLADQDPLRLDDISRIQKFRNWRRYLAEFGKPLTIVDSANLWPTMVFGE